MKVLLLACAAVPWLAAGEAVWAQTAPAASGPPGVSLQEIVVTAQRRSENLQSAAVAVAVVSGAAITERGITTPQDLTTLVPALAVQSPGGANTTFFVRGVGNFAVNGYTDPAIGFNYDGVYVGRPTSTSGMFYDLERVEVLKGPQGTLYGRNATAGAINVLPARPVLGRNEGFLTASYGDYSAGSVQGAANLALGDTAALRVAGNVVDHSGYLSDGTGDEKTQAARAQLLWEPASDLSVRIGGDYSHNGGKGTGAYYAVSYAYSPAAGAYVATPTGFGPRTGVLDPAAQALRTATFSSIGGRKLGLLDPNVYLDNNFYGVNGELNWKTDAGTLTFIPAWRRSELNNRFPSPGFIGFVQETDDQYSFETRFTGRRLGIFDYILGAYYYHEKVDGNYTFDSDVFTNYQDLVSSTRSYAVFGRFTAQVTDALRLVGGLRYTKDDKRFDGAANSITEVCTVRVAGVPSCPSAPVIPVTDTAAQLPFLVVPNGVAPIGSTGAIATSAVTTVHSPLSNSNVSWRAAVEYDVAPRSLLYASFEDGYRSGGFSLAAGHETFQPEYLSAYTLGMKNRFLDNRLQLNVEAFYWKYKSQQINHSGTDTRGNRGQFVENIGSSTIRGAEIESQYLLAPDTVVSADVQYLDAKFDSFVYKQPFSAVPPYTGCRVYVDPKNAGLNDVDCSGKQGYQSPRWTLNFGVRQTWNVDAYKLVLTADTQYKTGRFVGFDYTSFEHVGDTWTSNAALSLSPQADRWSVTAFVRNLENNRYPIAANQFTFGNLGALVTAPPRTYGVQVSLKF